MYALLGDITFEALASPETNESSSGATFAEHKTVESTPKLQWIGDELDELTLEILLHVNISDPASDLAALQAALRAHQAMALVFGSGFHAGYFVLTKITKSLKQQAADGSIIAMTLKLALKQWVQSIEIDPNAPPVPAFTPPGVIVGSLLPGQSVADVVAADGSVTFPATSKGVSTVVNNPSAPGAPAPGADPNMVDVATITRMDPSVGGVLV